MNDWIDGYDTQGVLVFGAIMLVPAIVAIAPMLLFPSERFLARWFEHHDLARSPEVEAMVVDALVTSKRIRTLGFIVAYMVPQLGWMLYTRDAGRSGELPFEMMFAGLWCMTVFLAAIASTPRSNASGRTNLEVTNRGALPAERRVDDYRPAFTRHDHAVLLAGLAIVAGLAWVYPGNDADREIAPWVVARLVAGSLAVMAMVRVGQRIIVSGRQTWSTIDLIRADDAIRTTGVSALTGLGYGVPLFAIATLFWQLVYIHEPGGAVTLISTLVSFALFGAALSMVIGFGRLGNEVVVYRHRLRPAAELEREPAETA